MEVNPIPQTTKAPLHVRDHDSQEPAQGEWSQPQLLNTSSENSSSTYTSRREGVFLFHSYFVSLVLCYATACSNVSLSHFMVVRYHGLVFLERKPKA